jgi:hypothetical protein
VSKEWATRNLPRPNAFIQWKGTGVCMDFYCLCGDQFHLDSDFTYAVGCPHCGRVYEMSSMIEAREVDPAAWDGCTIKYGDKDDE